MKCKIKSFGRYFFALVMTITLMAEFCSSAFADNEKLKSSAAKIKVAFYPLDGFFYYDDEGNEAGYGVDYLNEIAKYANIQWEYVPADSWEDIKGMMQDGEVDVRMPVSAPIDPTTSYSSFTTEALLPSYHAIMTLKSRDDIYYQDYSIFPNLKIGVTASLLEKTGVNDYLASINVLDDLVSYDDYNSCRDALDKGEIDALISNVMDLTNDMKVLDKFSVSNCYITTLKGNQYYRLINDAMTELSLENPSFQSQLYEKYYPERANEPFTREETEYIKNTDHITVGVFDDRKPVSYYDDKSNSYKGIAIDIANEISKKAGISFEYVPITTDNPRDMLDKVDLVMPVTGNGGENGYFVTESILDSEILMVVKEGKNVPNNNAKIGVLSSTNGIYDTVSAHSDYEIIRYKTNADALKALQNGEISGFTNASYVVNWLLENPRYSNLRALRYNSLPLEYQMCGNTDNTVLQSILTKSISSLSDDVQDQIIISNTSFSISDLSLSDKLYGYRYEIITVSIALLIIIIATLMYNHTRTKYIIEIEKRGREQEKANHAKSDFLARMSHDLRTPMNGILGLARLMQDETNDETLLKDIGQLEMSGQYLLQLINDTLDMSKIEAGKLELRLKPIDSESVFGNILSNASMLAKNKGVEFSVKTPDIPHNQWIPVMADASRLEQVLMNLLSNAVKFTPTGGKVDVVMETVSVTDETVTDRYIIRDTGIGISEEFLPHIFEPFSQEGRENTNRESGTGLGMPIVHQLVSLMNGEIDIKSTLGEGTEVTLLLRYERVPKSAAVENQPEIDYSILDGKHILLCEDHPLNSQIAIRLLEKKNVICELAENGQIGVDKFINSPDGFFDAVLMDIRMPIMNGIEAAKAIRATERNDAKTIPIIAMTANAYEEDIKETAAAGMNAHLSKPIIPEQMYETLAKAFENKLK